MRPMGLPRRARHRMRRVAGRVGRRLERQRRRHDATFVGRSERAQDRYREWARTRYRPPSYTGPVVLFRATQRTNSLLGGAQDALLGWGDVATGELVVHDVPSDHINTVQEPAVAVIAEKVGELINPDVAGSIVMLNL